MTGKVGADVTLEQAQEAAKIIAINLLATLKGVCVCMCMCVYVCVCVCEGKNMGGVAVFMCVCVYVCADLWLLPHTYIHPSPTEPPPHIYKHTHTLTHTHTRR